LLMMLSFAQPNGRERGWFRRRRRGKSCHDRLLPNETRNIKRT
jgi:hypothetical protein